MGVHNCSEFTNEALTIPKTTVLGVASKQNQLRIWPTYKASAEKEE